MKELKEYIEESLLDNFDDLNKNVDKVINRPFAELYKNVKKTGNWDACVKNFEMMITSDAQEVINHPMFTPKLARDEVFVAFYSESWDTTQRVYVRFNKTSFQRFKKSQGRSATYREPAIKIFKCVFNGKTSATSWPDNDIDMGKIKKGYILSKRHAEDALRMIDLMSVYGWNESNW